MVTRKEKKSEKMLSLDYVLIVHKNHKSGLGSLTYNIHVLETKICQTGNIKKNIFRNLSN